MTPQQALDLVCEYGLWKKEDPLPEKTELTLYSFVDGKRILHRFRAIEGWLVSIPEERKNA